MGLDMYLKRKTYVKNWDHMSDDSLHQISVKKNKKKHPYIDKKKITNIEEEVGYWRKANHIHNWFVENVQNGVDDCGYYFIEVSQLKQLHDTCVAVLEDHNKAEELLPTAQGFFFGGTEYDEYYFEELKETIKILDPLLKLDDEGHYPDYYYNSSW